VGRSRLCALVLASRRGELAGLLWSDVDGDQLHIRRTRTLANGRLVEGKPKTAKGYRTITISSELVAVLRRWRASQVEVMMRAGVRCDHVLTDEELKPWHPEAMGAGCGQGDHGRSGVEADDASRVPALERDRAARQRHWR
jgi:hypothetical protein